MRRSSLTWPLIAFLMSAGVGAWLSNRRGILTSSAETGRPLGGTVNATATPAEMKRAYPSDEEMLTAIMSAVAQEEPLLRAHQLHGTIGKLNSVELSALFDKALKLQDTDRRGPLIHALLARWMIVDPAAARAAVRPYLVRFQSTTRVAWRSKERMVSQAWAIVVPDEILAETMASPDASWAKNLAGDALKALSEGDPARQLEILAGLPDNRLRADLCTTAIRDLAQKDYAAAEARLDLVTDPRQRSRLQAQILGDFAARDPEAGLARLAKLAPNLSASADSIRLVIEVLGKASRKNPEAALSALDGLPEGLKTQAFGSVLVGWADKDPAAALAWSVAKGVDLSEAKAFSSFGESEIVSWSTFLMVAFDRDAEKTLEWIRTQPASAKRDEMLQNGLMNGPLEQKFRVYAELTPEGQVSAAADLVHSLRFGASGADQIESWVKDLPPGAARAAAIQELARFQAGSPARIAEIADAWAPGPDRDASFRGIASSLANTNPARALEFARQVTDPVGRESTFERIAQSWLGADKPAARRWITSAPELTSEQKRVLLRQADEQ